MLPPKFEAKIEKRLELLKHWRYAKLADVPLEMASTREHLRRPPEHFEYVPAPAGSTFGAHWETVWFRGQITLGKELRGRRVFYRNVSFAEKLLFINGEVFAGMNPFQQEVLLSKNIRGGESLQLYLEIYCGHPIADPDPYKPEMFTHQFIMLDPGQDPPLTLEASELLVEREQACALYYEADTLFRTARVCGQHSRRGALLFDAVDKALDRVPWRWDTDDELENAAKAARRDLAPLLAMKNSPSTASVGIAGHAHIDIGWLWPVRESIRKAARSFSSVLALMDDYAELRFVQSQAWLYDVVQQHYPELIPKIRKRVKEGRWEPNGGMWVEADCNVPSGESLVRQFLEGRKKLQELFGYTGDTLWLPDVFGYSAALPQILKLSGIDFFVTSKINWNDTNRFPHDTFWWEGIDGTRIFSHFISTDQEYWGYNSPVHPQSVQNPWNHVRHKELQDSCLSAVGYGDGGGGPAREMAEYALRMKDLEGCLKTEWVNVSQFLRRLREQCQQWPQWSGELYLELHRGTYTSQSRTKRYNRKLELLLREVELYGVLAMPLGYLYPAAQLQRLWRILLTNQFHDILPGSSIRSVFEVAEAEYAEAEQELTALRNDVLCVLGSTFVPDADSEAYIVPNALSWVREDIALIEAPGFNAACDAHGAPLDCQVWGDRLAVKVLIPPMGAAPVALRKKHAGAGSVFQYNGKTLDSPHHTIHFDKAGKITSLLHKDTGRELVLPGRRLNDIQCGEDLPVNWDAWDIDRYYREQLVPEDRLISREVVSEGPLFIALRSEYALGRKSRLTQHMLVYAHTQRIDFVSSVDWQERQTILKVLFPIDVHALEWRNEIQYGHVTRARHENTPWDQARFEVCAHKWVDVSEAGFGVALLNDSKYGHDCLDNAIGLTLLRSAVGPDEEADQGHHEFTYSLLPHDGGFSAVSVVRPAYELNVPLTPMKLGQTTGEHAAIDLLAVSEPNVIVEAVKKAEADDAIIVRLYEAEHRRTEVKISFNRAVRKATECNLMEEQDQPLDHRAHTIRLQFRPFEIKTLRVYLK